MRVQKLILLINIVCVLFILSACTNSEVKKEEAMEAVVNEFLTQYYTTTPEDVERLSEFTELLNNGKLSTEEAQQKLDEYAGWLVGRFSATTSKEEAERLMANRTLDRLMQLAIEKEENFGVNKISIETYAEKDDYTIYKYTVSLLCKSHNGTEEKSYEMKGLVLVESIGNDYLVNRTELQTEF